MTDRAIRELWHDGAFCAYLGRQARRHFINPDDQKDAIEDAWAKLWIEGDGLPRRELERISYRAIKAAYMRAWRLRKHCADYEKVE